LSVSHSSEYRYIIPKDVTADGINKNRIIGFSLFSIHLLIIV